MGQNTSTKHGWPVAELVPVRRHDREQARAAMERIRELTKTVDNGDITWEHIKKM
jgi:antitoxin (DNA-binding transcriptional repressor) of toxin-antitoxin stability system